MPREGWRAVRGCKWGRWSSPTAVVPQTFLFTPPALVWRHAGNYIVAAQPDLRNPTACSYVEESITEQGLLGAGSNILFRDRYSLTFCPPWSTTRTRALARRQESMFSLSEQVRIQPAQAMEKTTDLTVFTNHRLRRPHCRHRMPPPGPQRPNLRVLPGAQVARRHHLIRAQWRPDLLPVEERRDCGAHAPAEYRPEQPRFQDPQVYGRTHHHSEDAAAREGEPGV